MTTRGRDTQQALLGDAWMGLHVGERSSVVQGSVQRLWPLRVPSQRGGGAGNPFGGRGIREGLMCLGRCSEASWAI